MNIAQVERAAGCGAASLVLENGGDVPIPAPSHRNERIAVENIRTSSGGLEILPQPLEHREIGCDQHEMPRERGFALTQRVEIAPHDGEAHNFRFAGTGGEFEGVARPTVVVGVHAQRRRLGIGSGEIAHQSTERADATHFIEIDERLHCLALAEIVAERCVCSIGQRHEVIALEPVVQQFARGVRGTGIIRLPPVLHRPPQRLRNNDRRRTPAFPHLGLAVLGSRPVPVRLLVRSEQRLEGGQI